MHAFLCHFSFFFFNDTATTEIYTLSLHDALPICAIAQHFRFGSSTRGTILPRSMDEQSDIDYRSEEHTSELQSHLNLVCRLLLEKKKIIRKMSASTAEWQTCAWTPPRHCWIDRRN